MLTSGEHSPSGRKRWRQTRRARRQAGRDAHDAFQHAGARWASTTSTPGELERRFEPAPRAGSSNSSIRRRQSADGGVPCESGNPISIPAAKYDEALRLYEQALPIIQARYSERHPELASLLNNIARSKLIAGQVEEARPLFVRAIEITERSTEEESHDQLIAPLNSLAMIDAYNGNLTAPGSGASARSRSRATASSSSCSTRC